MASRTPLFHVAAAVANAMTGSALDVVQPMCNGWYIYMQTMADHELLVQNDINIVGRHVMLRSEITAKQRDAVKITIKDLPLHSVANNVLDAMNKICSVQSEVRYIKLWHDGKLTTIYNSDRFLYVQTQDIWNLPP